MFFSMGHGKRVVKAGEGPGTVPPQAAGSRDQSFGYLFPQSAAPDFPMIDGIDEKLDALAAALAEPTSEPDELAGTLPPVFTYLGQFIDHDISVNTDSDNDASKIDEVPLPRQPRGLIEANVMNGRRGSLGLDSLYGDVPEPNADSEALQAAMREGPFLREGMTAPIGGQRPVLPRSGGDDLPRIGPMIDAGVLDPDNLPEDLRPGPDPTDERRSLAFIGDGRNDENLVVAQLHLAFIRFHNAVARKIIMDARAPMSDDEVFKLAKSMVTWTYQWLIVNEFLPTICRRQDVAQTISEGAPLYSAFYERLNQGELGGLLPLPLEFSAAAYRYGHTMVRQNYDFNLNFGRAAFDTDGPDRRATLSELFQFTGRPGGVGGPFGPAPGDRLPQNWVIEWNRFVESRPLFPDRLARAIDTRLAPGLFNMDKEEPGIFKNLALRNLRRGYNMNLPSGQAMAKAMQDAGIALGPVINRTRLRAGPTGRALRSAGLDADTPLWFYVLKEAEEMEAGARLGTVGSFLVADTIVGLLKFDSESYWHQPGSGPNGRWHPRDGVSPIGTAITSINALLVAAGVLESGIGAPPMPVVPGSAIPRAASFTPFNVASLTAAIPAAVDRNQVRRDVRRAFNAAYKPLDENYEDKAPKDLFGTDVPRWSVHFRVNINVPLGMIYEWSGLTQAERFGVFPKSFSEVYETTVADILADQDD